MAVKKSHGIKSWKLNPDFMSPLSLSNGSFGTFFFYSHILFNTSQHSVKPQYQMVRILSVDLGVRNLAWCVLEREASTDPEYAEAPFSGMRARIRSWTKVDVTTYSKLPDLDSNLNKVDIADCVPMFVAALRAHKDELTAVDVALLETQPVGRVFGAGKLVSNVKTKVLSHILQAFLLEHSVPVIKFVSAKLKLSNSDLSTETYGDKKRAAVQTVTQIVSKLGTGPDGKPWSEVWGEIKGKKDDLADCLLQGIVAGRDKVRKPRAKKKAKLSESEPALVPDIE